MLNITRLTGWFAVGQETEEPASLLEELGLYT